MANLMEPVASEVLEPSIKGVKCNNLKWHNRAKPSLPWRRCPPPVSPAGVVAFIREPPLAHPPFADKSQSR